MALVDKNKGKIINNKNSNNSSSSITIEKQQLNLSIDELKLLMTIIRNATFQGENLELLYNLVLKLQEKYFSLVKEKEKKEG